ncbi:hypothetical protein IG631_10935 [Alternaria alternata]|nr:hypothetical protein IG631_10935 [Alternaria alternata]
MGNLYLDTWKADVALSLPSYMGQGSLGPSVILLSLSEYEEQPDTLLLLKLGITTFEAGLTCGELEEFAKINHVTCWTLKYGLCRIGLTASPTGHERQGSGSEDDDFEAYSPTFELLVLLMKERPDLSRGLRTTDSPRVPAQL